jgi:hypothetical protein
MAKRDAGPRLHFLTIRVDSIANSTQLAIVRQNC